MYDVKESVFKDSSFVWVLFQDFGQTKNTLPAYFLNGLLQESHVAMIDITVKDPSSLNEYTAGVMSDIKQIQNNFKNAKLLLFGAGLGGRIIFWLLQNESFENVVGCVIVNSYLIHMGLQEIVLKNMSYGSEPDEVYKKVIEQGQQKSHDLFENEKMDKQMPTNIPVMLVHSTVDAPQSVPFTFFENTQLMLNRNDMKVFPVPVPDHYKYFFMSEKRGQKFIVDEMNYFKDYAIPGFLEK